jgi:hypothetical protein
LKNLPPSLRSALAIVLLVGLVLLASSGAARAAADNIQATASQSPIAVVPAGSSVELYRLQLLNTTVLGGVDTLKAVTFENRTAGGNATQKDASFSTVTLVLENRTSGSTPVDTASFSAALLRFSGLRVTLAPGDTVILHVIGGASAAAHDGDALDLRVPNTSSLTFSPAVSITGNLDPAGAFIVNGMGAHQIGVHDVPYGRFAIGSTRNLALDLTVPPNGYTTDKLQKIDIQNAGTAVVGRDIAGIEAWVDDGDGRFDPTTDTRLGAVVFTGDRWELSGISVDVPLTGRRLFCSVNIGPQALEGSTVRLTLPTPPDVAFQMGSNNDGPVDEQVTNRYEQIVSANDRVALSAVSIEALPVRPGDRDVMLLDLAATNSYSLDKHLTALTVTDATAGTGSVTERDAETERLALYLDTNQDGALDGGDDLLGTSFFLGGRCGFGNFSVDLPPGKTMRLFVTADVSLTRASDGDAVGAKIADEADFGFSDATALLANFPIRSGAAAPIDGQVAGEVIDDGAAGLTLAPNDGPVAALDVVVRRNGYRDDVLTGLSVIQLGSAVPAQLAELRLWRDGGDGRFNAGAGDDIDLGVLTRGTTTWQSGGLTAPLGAAGARLYVAARIAGTVTDSAMIRLAIPPGGIQVGSDNDGPLDASVSNPQSLLLSTRALLASWSAVPRALTVGQTVTVTVTVRNVSGETYLNVTPSSPAVSGTGGLGSLSPPSPISASIPAGGSQVFTWTAAATASGDVTLAGSASGTSAQNGKVATALLAQSNAVRIFDRASPLALSPTDAMPLSVNRGQSGVIALYLGFTNLSSADAGDEQITGLQVRLESGGGAGLVPASMLSRVVVTDGTQTFLDRSSLETTGSTINLALANPIVVRPGLSTTVALAIDVSDSTTSPDFRLVIPDSTWFTAEDAVSGAPVTVLPQGTAWPVRSGLARIVTEATELDVAAIAAPNRTAGPGQTGVPLLTTRLTNPGVSGVSSDVRVSTLAVQLFDSAGVRVASPSSRLQRIRARTAFQTLADRPVTALDDSVIALSLTPLLSVPANNPIDVEIVADLSDSTALGAFHLELADSGLVDARDANSGRRVPVTYQQPPIAGPIVIVQARAESLMVVGVGRFPANTAVGATNVAALDLSLRHPGGQGTAAIRLDTLAVRCIDDAGNPVVPATFVQHLRVRRNGVDVGTLLNPPASGSLMQVGLTAPVLVAGDTDTLTIALDFQSTAPAGYFGLTLVASGVDAMDANLARTVIVAPESGSDFPFISRLTHIVPPSRTLEVALDDGMPALLAADGRDVTVGGVTLVNTASAGSGPIAVSGLTVRAADVGFGPIALGAAASRVTLLVNGTPWATSATLAVDSTRATLSGASTLSLDPATPLTLELQLTPRTNPTVPALRVGLDAAGIAIVQPVNPLLAVAVLPAGGRSFTQWSAAGSFATLDFRRSVSNYPNPFAAGRQVTTFVYYLPRPGRVTLRIYTARGERVVTLADGAAHPSGLQQRDVWDGRNGAGTAVVNGAYLATLEVRYDDGSSDRVLRSVGVVR